jgi:hypothetical protein
MNKCGQFLFGLIIALGLQITPVMAEELEPKEDEWDLDFFDGRGWTPRYAYLDDDNIIGYAHYAGLAYYQRAGSSLSGMAFRYGHGTRGHKYNIAYSNSFGFMSVDFGLSYHVLDDDNPRDLEDLELLGLEMGLRFWVVQIIATHTEDTSFATLAYGF